MKRFAVLLIVEILGVVIAMSSFRAFSNRLVAGAVAGAFFVLIGGLIVGMGLKDPRFRRTFTFVAGCVHLFVVALPLMTVRFLNSTTSFEEIRIWWLPAPLFHQISGVIYWVLMIGTILDGIFAWRRERRKTTAG